MFFLYNSVNECDGEDVHENPNLNKMKSNAAKFASIINNGNEKEKMKSDKIKIVGINLDQNRFSDLANLENLEGRFWDVNSNANVNANVNTETGSKMPRNT